MSEDAIAEACPVCSGNCNCKACLCLDAPKVSLSFCGHLLIFTARLFISYVIYVKFDKILCFLLYYFFMSQLQFRISEHKKVEHSKYLLQVLLPFLKRVNDGQMIEVEIEARRQGIFCFCQTGVV